MRILHITDVHGQLKPMYFREPNVNLGVGDAFGRPPHVVGNKLLDAMGLKTRHTGVLCLHLSRFRCGRTEVRTHRRLCAHEDAARPAARPGRWPREHTDHDGGGSVAGLRHLAVDARRRYGRGIQHPRLDIMVGHWEFTYKEDEVLSNVALFRGDFIGQNVRVKPDSLFGDSYPALVEKYDGRGLFDEDNGYAFQPYVIKEINGARIAVVGQAFPRTANANPQEFFPDWSFGLREDDMVALVQKIREEENRTPWCCCRTTAWTSTSRWPSAYPD